jgi:hypothetical protein
MNDSVATVKITRKHSSSAAARAGVAPDLLQAVVTRNGLVEYIIESLSEQTLRNTLRRAGYPHTKKAVPVSA